MQPAFNQSIRTPLGQGRIQGPTQREDRVFYLVRLPVNEQTKIHLHDHNCLTPKAIHSGLWAFQEGELQ